MNECQTAGTCMQSCNNTVGSYRCTCNDAFKVDPSDSSKCVREYYAKRAGRATQNNNEQGKYCHYKKAHV